MTTSLRPLLIYWTVAAGLSLISPAIGLILLLVSIPLFPKLYTETAHQLKNSPSIGPYSLITGVFVFIFFWLMDVPMPSDDLLRHVPSFAYGYDHRAIFPYSSLPTFNLYPLFEHILGTIAQYWSVTVSIQLTMFSAWFAAMLVATGLARKYGGGFNAGTVVILSLVFSSPLAGRLFLGRPEVFCAIWGFSALLCKRPRTIVLWSLGGLGLSASYWLFPLYAVFAALLKIQWRSRFLITVGLGLFHLIFWSWNAGGFEAYIHAVGQLSTWTAARLAPIGETSSIWKIFLQPQVLLLALMAGVGFTYIERTERTILLALFALFTVPNMVRYSTVLVYLLAIMALPIAPRLSAFAKKHIQATILVLLLPLLAASMAFSTVGHKRFLPQFKLPTGSVVLTAFDEATFALPFFNPGTVQVVPAMELGASDLPYQTAAVALSNGKLECSQLTNLKLTHVVEHSQEKVLPCLRLVAIQGKWRLWAVGHD